MLDELTSSGEVYWVGDGAVGDADGWVRWYLADQEPHLAHIEPAHYRSQELLAALAGGGHFFESLLPPGLATSDRAAYVAALWDLVWAGLVVGDTFAPGARARGPEAPTAGLTGPPPEHLARASPAVVWVGPPGCRWRRLSSGRWALVSRGSTVRLQTGSPRMSSPSLTGTG